MVRPVRTALLAFYAVCLLAGSTTLARTVQKDVTVILIRHGESTWNPVAGGWRGIGKFLQGDHFTDAPLNAEGIHDAENLNRYIRDAAADAGHPDSALCRQILARGDNVAVVASPLSRAHDTAAYALRNDDGDPVAVRVAPFLQETCSNRDCTARLPAGTRPSIARMHARALGNAGANNNFPDGLRTLFEKDVAAAAKSRRRSRSPDPLDRVRYLAGSEVRSTGKVLEKNGQAAVGGVYAHFDMSMWNADTVSQGKKNGCDRMLDLIRHLVAVDGKDTIVVGGHSMWIKTFGKCMRTEQHVDNALATTSHTAKIFLRGDGKKLSNLFMQDDKLANGGALKLKFQIAWTGAPDRDVGERMLTKLYRSGNTPAITKSVKEFAARHGVGARRMAQLLPANLQNDQQLAACREVARLFGSTPSTHGVTVMLQGVEIFYDGQGGRAFKVHKLFRDGDKQLVVNTKPFHHKNRAKNRAASERIMDVVPIGAPLRAGSGAVVRLFQFTDSAAKVYWLSAQHGVVTATDVPDPHNFASASRVYAKRVKYGTGGRKESYIIGQGQSNLGSLFANPDSPRGTVKALEFVADGGRERQAKAAYDAVLNALRRGSSGIGVVLRTPDSKGKMRELRAGVVVKNINNPHGGIAQPARGECSVSYNAEDKSSAQMSFRGKLLHVTVPTATASVNSAGSTVMWKDTSKGTVNMAQGHPKLLKVIKGTASKAERAEVKMLQLVTKRGIDNAHIANAVEVLGQMAMCLLPPAAFVEVGSSSPVVRRVADDSVLQPL